VDSHLSGTTVANCLLRHYQSKAGHFVRFYGLAPDGVYMCLRCCQRSGALLPHLSTLTANCSGLFLLHCPWSRLRRMLSGILPCGARTFLML